MNLARWILRNLAVAVIWSVGAVLMASIPTSAASYSISRITNNNYDDRLQGLNNAGQLVWEGGGIVYLRESNGTIQQIANLHATHPLVGYSAINDAGQIVWKDWDGAAYVIYLSNPNNRANPLKIASTLNTMAAPQINNCGQIAWYHGNGTIYLYSNGSTALLPCGFYPSFDLNNKGQIVWENGLDLYLYSDGVSSQILAGGDGEHNSIEINDSSQAVWSGWNSASSSWEIFFYDYKNGSAPKQISNGNLGSLGGHQINNNGQVIWYADADDYGYRGLYIYDSASDTNQAISQGDSVLEYPFFAINDFGQVAWCSRSSDGYGLYLSTPGSRDNPIKIDKMFGTASLRINNLGQIAYHDGHSSYADTEIYLATPQVEVAKKVYGICIGSKHVDYTDPVPVQQYLAYRGDKSARLMAEKLGKLAKNDQNIKPFIGDFDAGGIKKSDIRDYLNGLSVNPDDLLIIYITGHGNHSNDGQYYYVQIGPDISTPGSEGFLSDEDLYTYLQTINCNKWVLIESCHSGGFQTKLANLNKLGLLTAVSKDGYAPALYLLGDVGWFTSGLLSALSYNSSGKLNCDKMEPLGKLSFDELYIYTKLYWPLTQEFQSAIGTTMYELGFGDPVVFTADKYDPAAIKTSDLVGVSLSGNITAAIGLLLLAD